MLDQFEKLSMENSPELNDALQAETEQEGDQTLIVPPPSFRERLRAAQRSCNIEFDPPPHAQATPSVEEAAQSSKRR
jgi:hypothetical protein